MWLPVKVWLSSGRRGMWAKVGTELPLCDLCYAVQVQRLGAPFRGSTWTLELGGGGKRVLLSMGTECRYTGPPAWQSGQIWTSEN